MQKTARGRLSDKEKARIVELAEGGLRAGKIAQHLGRLHVTVHHAMISMGLVAPIARTFSYTRRGRPVRSFSGEEDAFIEELRRRGTATPAIARACELRFGHRRTPATICIRLRGLAAKEEA